MGSERAADAAALYYELIESYKANSIDGPTYLPQIHSHEHNRVVQLPALDELANRSTIPAGRCAL